MKLFYRTLGTLALAAALVPSLPAADTSVSGKVVFWHNYGDVETPFFQNTILPLFKAQYPNVEVEAVRQENNQYNQLVVTAMGTGSLPDVARVDIQNVASYAKVGALLALDALPGLKEIQASVYPGTLSSTFFRGKYYGLPLDTNAKAAVFNTKNLAKLGLTKAPATMEELIAASKAKSPGQYTINVSGAGDWDMLPWFWLFGGVLTNDTFTKATGFLDSAASVKALQTIVDLHAAKVFTVKEIDGTVDAWQAIKEDQISLFLEGPWFFSFTPDAAKLGIQAAPVPTYNGKTATVLGGEDVVIFSTTKNKTAAWAFTKFLLSSEVQEALASVNQMPVVKSLAAKFGDKGVWPVYLKMMESAKARIPSPQYSTIATSLRDAFNAALTGAATPAAALKSAATDIDAQLAR